MRRFAVAVLCLLLVLSVLSAQAATLISVGIPYAVSPTSADAQSGPKDVKNLLDGLISSVYSYTGWSSTANDETPEVAFDFTPTDLAGVWLRAGNQRSSLQYEENARPRIIRVRVITNYRAYSDYTFEIADTYDPSLSTASWHKGYQLMELPQTIRSVTRVELYITDWYKGSVNANTVTMTDVLFVSQVTAPDGSATATPMPYRTATPKPTATPLPYFTRTPVPTVTPNYAINGDIGGALYALLTDRITAYSGPGLAFDSMGSFLSAGQQVEVLSYDWDSSSAAYWYQVEFTYSGQRRRAYTPMNTISVNVNQVPRENRIDSASLLRSTMAYTGPGLDYVSAGVTLSALQQCDVYAIEDGWALLQYYDVSKRCYRRVWVPAVDLDFSEGHG